MKLTLEPTELVQIVDGVPHRVWKGTSDAGTPVEAWVRCVQPQTHDEAQLVAFDRELMALPAPRRQPFGVDLRFIL